MTSKTGNRRGKGQTAQSQVIGPAAVLTIPAALAIPATPARKTKAALLRDLLSAPSGTSLHTLMEATGWQAHTVRAALSGLRKSGVTLIRTQSDAGLIYAIVTAGDDSPEKPEAEPARPRSRKNATKAATKQAESMIAAVDGDVGGAGAVDTVAGAAAGVAASS